MAKGAPKAGEDQAANRTLLKFRPRAKGALGLPLMLCCFYFWIYNCCGGGAVLAGGGVALLGLVLPGGLDGEVVELGFIFELGFVVVFGTVLGVLLGEFGAAFGVVLGVLGVTSGVAPGSVCMVEELGLVAAGGFVVPGVGF